MTEGFNTSERKQFRDPVAGNTLVARLSEVGYSRNYLAQIVGADPSLFNDAEALVAATYANSQNRDTLSADEPTVTIPETPENVVSAEETILTDTADDQTPPAYLPEENPFFGGEE
jgi:hypothetical protein